MSDKDQSEIYRVNKLLAIEDLGLEASIGKSGRFFFFFLISI